MTKTKDDKNTFTQQKKITLRHKCAQMEISHYDQPTNQTTKRVISPATNSTHLDTVAAHLLPQNNTAS